MTCGDYIIHIDNAEDGDKFRIIYQRYSRLMIYCAKKIVNDHHIAEDITQQAFMKVIPRLKTISLKEPEKTKNLLITITERTAIEYYRKEMRKANSISLKDIDSLKTDSDMLVLLQKNPVEKAIYQLPDIYKEVFVLKYCNQFSNHEISKILKVREGTIRQRLARGKEALREILKKEGIDVE